MAPSIGRLFASAAFAAFACMHANPATAQDKPLRFSLPVDCVPNETCYIQKYVDMAPGDAYADYKCGSLSNDGHKGTDIRLPTYRDLRRGVNVLAAAGGTVREVRDYMPDVNADLVGPDAVRSRGYGNLVVIEHRDGYVTAYAHMMRDSLAVRPGEQVSRGQVLGKMGLSGLTEFPHLHFEVIKGGKRLDPFTGARSETTCGRPDASLWTEKVRQQLTYNGIMLMRQGFSEKPVNRHAMEYGLLHVDQFPRDGENLIYQVFLAGLREGDEINLRIDHEGTAIPVAKVQRILKKDRAVADFILGKKGKGRPWLPGRYTGIVSVSRTNATDGGKDIILSADMDIEVPD